MGYLRGCAVFAPSPICLIGLGRCAPRALHLAILATFFNKRLIGVAALGLRNAFYRASPVGRSRFRIALNNSALPYG